MFKLRLAKTAKLGLGGIVILTLVLVAAFAMRSTAPRNESMTRADKRIFSPDPMGVPPQPPVSISRTAANNSGAEELGRLPGKLDSPYRLFFIDEKNGWFADDENLWNSTDGGRNWKLLSSSKDSMQNVFFSNLQTGWLERGSGIYRTEDGGIKWTRVVTPLDYPKGMIGGMYFLNNGQTGWIAGGVYKSVSLSTLLEEKPASYLVRENTEEGGYGLLYQSIFRTNDGGRTWQKQLLPDKVGEIFSLRFVDDMHGVALGDNWIFFTKDGGKQWKSAVFKQGCVDPAFIKFPDSQPVAVAFAENGLAWVSYDNGRLLKSNDIGETWCDLLTPEEVWKPGEQGAFFRDLYFFDSLKGWGLKDNGTLFRTKNGGLSWTQVNLNGKRVWDAQFLGSYALLVTADQLFGVRFDPTS